MRDLMKHYYTDNTDLESEIVEIKYTYNDIDLVYQTDNGVFSKKAIDYGSRVLLENIVLKDQAKVIDVGCGYGTFGIALKKCNNIEVDMVDVNNRAINLAIQNAKLNNVIVNVFESNVYDAVKCQYDVIVTNPPIRAGKEIVMKIINESSQFLREDGEIWVIIQKKQGAPSVKKRLEELYGHCDIVKRDKGYYLLKSGK